MLEQLYFKYVIANDTARSKTRELYVKQFTITFEAHGPHGARWPLGPMVPMEPMGPMVPLGSILHIDWDANRPWEPYETSIISRFPSFYGYG